MALTALSRSSGMGHSLPGATPLGPPVHILNPSFSAHVLSQSPGIFLILIFICLYRLLLHLHILYIFHHSQKLFWGWLIEFQSLYMLSPQPDLPFCFFPAQDSSTISTSPSSSDTPALSIPAFNISKRWASIRTSRGTCLQFPCPSVFTRWERQRTSQWMIGVASDAGQYLHVMIHQLDFVLVSVSAVTCLWIKEFLGSPPLFWLAIRVVAMWRLVDCILRYWKCHVLRKFSLSFFGFREVSPPLFWIFISPAGNHRLAKPCVASWQGVANNTRNSVWSQ